MPVFVIHNSHGLDSLIEGHPAEYWSDVAGWGSLADADRHVEADPDANLPAYGEWEELP